MPTPSPESSTAPAPRLRLLLPACPLSSRRARKPGKCRRTSADCHRQFVVADIIGVSVAEHTFARITQHSTPPPRTAQVADSPALSA